MKFEYHVKPTGSDAACGDAEHPFATISKAAQMASPGDTVIPRTSRSETRRSE